MFTECSLTNYHKSYININTFNRSNCRQNNFLSFCQQRPVESIDDFYEHEPAGQIDGFFSKLRSFDGIDQIISQSLNSFGESDNVITRAGILML